MTNARKKAKSDKKARERLEKAKRVKAQRIVEKKAAADQERQEPKNDQPGFKNIDGKGSSKPSSRTIAPPRRTQGK